MEEEVVGGLNGKRLNGKSIRIFIYFVFQNTNCIEHKEKLLNGVPMLVLWAATCSDQVTQCHFKTNPFTIYNIFKTN